MARLWFEGVENIPSLVGVDYISEIKKFSFFVPSISLRKLYMIDLLGGLKEKGMDTAKASSAISVIISTSRLSDFDEIGEELGEACCLIYESGDASGVLSYVLSEDWGKFLRFERGFLSRIFNVFLNEKYRTSREVAKLTLKSATVGVGLEVIQGVEGRNFRERYVDLLEACVGFAGASIKDAAFMTRRNVERSWVDGEKADHSDILDYSLRFSEDDILQYSIIALAARTFSFDVPLMIREMKAAKSEAAKYILMTHAGANLVWSRVQLQLAAIDVPPYKRSAIRSNNISKLYHEINALKLPSISFGDTVGVVMTTHNPCVDLMRESVFSILNQTYENIELIIVDDFSDFDIYENICRMVDGIRSDRIKIHRMTENVGQYMCRNYAINLLNNADYIAIQDDDDVSHPCRIERQVQALSSKSQAMLCMCFQVRFTEDLLYVPDRKDPSIFDPSPASTMFKADLIRRVGRFADVRSRGDVEFLSRVRAACGADAVIVVEAPLYLMRAATSTISSTKDFYFKTQLDILRSIMGNDLEEAALERMPYALRG